MNTPLVSVITPCYNGETYVDRFLESLLNQTYENIELIFVNDGSKDRTEEIFNSYKDRLDEKCARAIYVYQENEGVAQAINNGLKYAQGEFITWPDSDDILYDECIEKKVQFLSENRGCAGVVTKGNRVPENNINEVIGELKISHSLPFENLFERLIFEKNVYLAPVGFMLRSDCLFSVLKNRSIYNSPGGQNWQMLLPVAYNYKFGFIDEVLFSYVVRDSSHSRREKEYEDNIKKTYTHEDCLVNTIKTIDMPKAEKEKLYHDIGIKYIRKRMNIAKQFLKKSDVNSFFSELKNQNCILKDDVITYRRINSPTYDFIYRLILKAKSILKGVLKYVQR